MARIQEEQYSVTAQNVLDFIQAHPHGISTLGVVIYFQEKDPSLTQETIDEALKVLKDARFITYLSADRSDPTQVSRWYAL